MVSMLNITICIISQPRDSGVITRYKYTWFIWLWREVALVTQMSQNDYLFSLSIYPGEGIGQIGLTYNISQQLL